MPMTKRKQKTFTINRKTWARGQRCTSTMLLNPSDGTQCCLGFVCEQSGVPRTELAYNSEPQNLELHVPYLTHKNGGNTGLTEQAIDINDDFDFTDEERERKLTELFATKNIKLEFVG